jgi:hypothetical protein
MCALHDEPWTFPPRDQAREEPVLDRLGPPGWGEFAAARRRFETTLVVQGLELALTMPPSAETPDRRGDP